MATSGPSQPCSGNKKEHQDPQSKINLSGLKHQLHGTSYQVKLGTVVSLANAKKLLDPTEKFRFTVTAEDPTAGKFDDIVYAFQHGEKTGTLKIQAKHKLSSTSCKIAVEEEDKTTATEIQVKHKEKQSIPKITLKDCIADFKNDFCIEQYFKSFRDQPQPTNTTGLEGLIICTNAALNDDAKALWNEIETAVPNDSTTSLDSYISSLFHRTGGKCYRLKIHYKCAALARLLINAVKSKEQMVTWQKPLFKEYRAAILDIIDCGSSSDNGTLFRFKAKFLDSSSTNSKPGYEEFREEFEDQYRQEFKIVGCVWKDLEQKRVYVSKNFLLNERNRDPSSDVFPEECGDELFKSFCDQFRLVCGTYNEQELDAAIAYIWRDLNAYDSHMISDSVSVEEDVVIEKLFKANFEWLKNPFAKPLDSEDIKNYLKNIGNTLAQMKLKGISDKLRRKMEASPFRIGTDALKASDLYMKVQTENILQVETYDVQFGATVLSDILDLLGKISIFLDESDFLNHIMKEKNIIPSLLLHNSCLILIYNGMSTVPIDMLKNYEKQVFLIKKSCNTQTREQTESVNLSEFCVRDLTEESWNQFLGETIPLCSTTILPSKIFQEHFRERSIEEVIRLLDWGKEMEENYEISKKYFEIENTYVHRPWVDSESKLEAENIWWNEDGSILKSLKGPQQEGMSFNEITESLKKDSNFIKMFGKSNNPEEENEPIVDDRFKKVLILLGEAGLGKSTNLTWMAWYLRKQNPSSWVVRCNLSDHCSNFKPFVQHQNHRAGKVINETEALRILYKLVCPSLQVQHQVAEKCSKCLGLSNGEAILNEDLIEQHDLSLNNLIQLLVFKNKFNSGELELLLDGFDEIAPLYKEVVLKILSRFEHFKGVEKLYLTSRPYGFKQQFQAAFKDPSFFQLKPLSLKDKGSIPYKLMKEKWHDGNIDDVETLADFYKSLCFMLLCSLGSMSNIALNLMMAVDILGECVNHNETMNVNFLSQPFNKELLETILKLSKASFIVEEFVKVKIRHLLYDKNGADKNVADKPEEMVRFEKVIDEAKLLHGLVALWELFNNNERHIILSPSEIQAGEDYMKRIHEGSEKIGIIHAGPNGGVRFIHRTFVEYLAAWWFVKRRIEGNKQGGIKIMTRELFWKRKELRMNIDTILAKRYPLHVAIIEKEWGIVESLLSENLKSLYKRDDGNKTSFHLIALYYDFEEVWPPFLPDSIESNIINTKDNLFGWTAMDYAFLRDKTQLIYYLLHHRASINVEVLYDQIVSSEKDIVRNAAKYARYVMGYLSSEVIEYKSHDACKKMKQFCDKVVTSLDIESSVNSKLINDGYYKTGDDNDNSDKKNVEDIIAEDSVWMLESIINRWAGSKRVVRWIRNSIFDLESDAESIFVLRYFMAKDPSILNDNNLWDCIVLSINKNYKDEFKYFFDLYCSRFKINHFQPCLIQSDSIDCSIQNDVASYLIDCVEDNIDKLVCDFRNNICLAQLGTPAEIFVTGNILSLLIICLATGRPFMIRYLVESCKLNLCAGTVYSLAMTTNNLYLKTSCMKEITPNLSYKCLLDIASNIADVDANQMFRLAITSQLFEFSKCLIERFKIDFQAVDETNGWNVFHLCASNQRSFWVEKLAADEAGASYVDGDITNLFRYMMTKELNMDCFGTIDKRGRSILHLALENGQRGIVEHIVARKLGLNHINEIKNLRVDAIPNITFCYRSIQEISKSVEEKWWLYELICMLAKQIAKISLTNREESQEINSGHLLLQGDAKELYQMAMKRRSLFLMYYLHREFPSAIPSLIYDENWLVCTARSLRSPEFFDVTKWLLNPNEMDKYDNSYEVVEKCDAEGYDFSSVDKEKLVTQAEAILSANRSVEELCKLKLLVLAVCLKRESMIRYLCESLNVHIDWKVLVDIMEIAHKSYRYKPGTKFSDGCAFEKPDFIPIYKYLFERTSNLDEIDAEGRNVLNLAAQNGLGCMAKFLIKHNKVNVTITTEQNGWNIFHYYASRKGDWRCCYTKNDELLELITKRVLGITSDDFPLSSLTESRKNKIKELCFNSNEGRKNVIHIAVEAGNIYTAEFIIKCHLGINRLYEHEIRNSDECTRFRECYDELSQIAAQLPFNAWLDYLLHKLAKSIFKFSPEYIEHITGQEDVEDHIVEEACRSAIKYRSLITMEHLIIAYKDQMNQSLARSTSHELVSCMRECIRRNRTSMFKVLVGHYLTLQGIQSRVEVEFEMEENDNIDEGTISEKKIKGYNHRIINHFTEDEAMNRDCLPLVILSVAYGRHPMIRYLVEMFKVKVDKSLIVSIMKVLQNLWDENCKVATPVYEYLANRCEGNSNLLHLCTQAMCWTMLKFLIEERKLDPNEIDSENGWNAGHYCVSEPNVKTGYDEFTWLVDQYNMDCLGVYDRNGRSILYLALENGFDRTVKYIINHRLGLVGDKQPWYEWDLEEIEKLINELQQTIKSLPKNIPHKKHQIIHDVLQTVQFYMVDRTFANSGQPFNFDCKNDNERNENKNTEGMVRSYSGRELMKDQEEVNKKLLFELINKSYFVLAMEKKSIFVFAYFGASNLSFLTDEYLRKCTAYAVLKNYNIEFKSFFDLYCSQIKIKDFQPCSIQSDKAFYLTEYSKSDEIDEVCDRINNICWIKQETPAEIMIDEKILSLLVLCVATVRPSMLSYLIESCKLNLCAGIVYSLALITNNLLSKISCKKAIKQNPAYECMLDLASNISDVEANQMFRLAITSQLFEFSKCLIERFKIDFQAVDETNGWNVFHLCASNQRSFWVEKLAADEAGASYVDGDITNLFRYMMTKELNMDCFGTIDKRGRSILHLALENGQRGIVEHIVARKLGLNHINEIKNLRVDAIPNITFCYRSIQEISKSVEEKWWHYDLICLLAKQIAKISLTNREESQEINSGHLLLQGDAKELYQMAMKRRSLFLMYYLHREFPNTIPPLMHDANWLACTARSLYSPDFLDFTKWLLNPNEVGKHDNLYKVVEECDDEGYDFNLVNLENLIKRADAILSANRSVEDSANRSVENSANRSVEELCKLKLLAVAVCLKRESMIRHLCETLNVKMDWKVLVDIMVIAHQSRKDEPGTKDTDGCAFEKDDFIPIYKYLFDRTTNLGEIDAEGRNVLHLAAQNGLGCMAKFLIKHNMVNVTTTNEQNGWNIFHYYVSRKTYGSCCDTENDELLPCMTKRVVTSDDFPLSSLTESPKNKLKELCFNSDEGRKSVIHVAVEAGNTFAALYIIECRLGIGEMDKHEIRNSDECSRFRECYDELSQIATQLPFNVYCDYLLHRLAKSIHRFTPENVDHIKRQENIEDHIIEEACRSAIKYRSLITLERLIVVCEDQMNQALAKIASNELVSCMMECIRRNRTSMFKIFVGHYRTLQGILPRVEVGLEEEENDNIDEVWIDKYKINLRIVNDFTEDVVINRNYLPLFIWLVAYGRLSMIRYLVEMLELEVNKSLIVLIMKVLEDLWDENCKVATPVYEYLANRCEGNPNLLHLCTQAGCWTMLKYLIEERKFDPNEIDSENGWNAGHYCVSDPNVQSGYDVFIWLVDQYNIDCLGVYDRKGRNILHLALENDFGRVVKYIINHRLGLIGDKKPWYEWDSEKIEKLINELRQTIKSLPEKIPHQEQQVIRNILEKLRFQRDTLTTYQQLFTNQT